MLLRGRHMINSDSDESAIIIIYLYPDLDPGLTFSPKAARWAATTGLFKIISQYSLYI